MYAHKETWKATAKHLWHIAQLALAQQQEIKQLKAELEELKQRSVDIHER
jgi:cell division protein FtsB